MQLDPILKTRVDPSDMRIGPPLSTEDRPMQNWPAGYDRFWPTNWLINLIVKWISTDIDLRHWHRG